MILDIGRNNWQVIANCKTHCFTNKILIYCIVIHQTCLINNIIYNAL